MEWLLESTVFEELRAAVESGKRPSAQDEAAHAERLEARAAEGSRIMKTAGDKARIEIFGVLTQRPSFMAMIFGGGNTTYGEINAALAEAQADPDVKQITLAIDSPGGEFAGLFDTLEAFKAVTKPVRAVVHNIAASAAYAIASQASTIEAANRAARVGSVGIVARFFVDENQVSVTSTNAPNKAPDVTTPKGKAVVRAQLDELHEVFVDAIARGRDIPSKTVNSKFGRGAVVIAEQAVKRGMIDSVAGMEQTTGTAASGAGHEMEASSMDIQTLKADHPDVYAAVFGAGVAQERDRVTAHLLMGESSGDVKTASAAIRDGAEMTATLQAAYMSAGMNRADQSARQDDDAAGAAPAADGAAPAPTDDDTAADAVLDRVEANLKTEV